MQSQLYVSISAQLALQRRLETIANNIANVSTTGFRADEIAFEQLLSKAGAAPTSFVSRGDSVLSVKSGEFAKTGNPLDIAVRGSAWLAIQTGDAVTYSRDGRMKLSQSGILTTMQGDSVLDASGSPIQLDVNGGTPQIGTNGVITQGARRVGAIGIFSMVPGTQLLRAEGASVLPDTAPVPELDFNTNGIVQGYLEKSNVNPVQELSRLIAVQRAFEAVSTTIAESETAMQDVARALAGT